MRNLQALRETLKMSRADLAKRSGVTEQTINNLEQKAVSWPQAEIRRSLEVATGQRINWLSTLEAYDTGTALPWEKLEEVLRALIVNVNTLPAKERNDFITVCREYLNSFEAMLQDDEIENSDILYPTDVYAEIRRKRECR